MSILRQASSSSQAEQARPPSGGRGEEMQGGIMAKSSVKIGLGKPLEELMDSDIMELSREDCRQYLQERGLQKLSWNNQHSIQQVLSHRHHPDSQGKDEATGKRESKDGPHHISSPALSKWEQTNKSSPSYPQAVCCLSICLPEVFLLHSCLDHQIFLVLEKSRFYNCRQLLFCYRRL